MPTNENSLLQERKLTPMDALRTLYGEGEIDAARAIIGSLSRRIFEAPPPEPSGAVRRLLARGVLRLMQRTTRSETRTGPDGVPMIFYRNSILESSKHPYAATLLEPSRADTSNFVEGGDPMNAVYMMLAPEVRRHATLWDNIMLDSVQARDVQWRLVVETRMTFQLAAARLQEGQPVRLKAAAAGTGLSMILVLNRLLQEGHDPSKIAAFIGDREESNTRKTLRLLEKLPSTRPHLDGAGSGSIKVRQEDLLQPSEEPPADVVTLVGILEYFPGGTATTTEELQGEPPPREQVQAADIVRGIARLTAPGGSLLVNTYRLAPAARILENFGKRFRYRGRPEMQQLLGNEGFVTTGRHASANIFDLEVFRREAPEVSARQRHEAPAG